MIRQESLTIRLLRHKNKIVVIFLGLLAISMGIFTYGYIIFPKTIISHRQQIAPVIPAVKQQNQKFDSPAMPKRVACRQLPAHMNRAGLPLWGKSEADEPVQLEEPVVELLSKKKRQEIKGVARRVIASMNVQEEPRTDIQDSLKDKIELARKRVLALQTIPCAYEWNLVRAIVDSYGPHLILRNHGDADLLSQFDSRVKMTSTFQNAKRISDSEAEQENDVTLSARMVENATALVFARSVSILSGFRPDSLDAFRTVCVQFNTSYTGYEQAAILLNRGRYLEAIQVKGNPDVKMIQDLDRGVPNEFIRRISDTVRHMGTVYAEAEKNLPVHTGCRFPPEANGPNEGMELFPNDLSDPIINLVELLLSEQTKVAFASR